VKKSTKYWYLGIIVLLITVYFGCISKRPIRLYKMSDGTVIGCRYAVLQDCGMTLSECDSGKKYVCEANVSYIGEYND
jgi:hypothetical protein